ncbi:MAG: hypothetical protein A3K68_03730 [Euryarchaeota archaeon RBG_16_68_13]|nr:MAG: hypothetical protein A3K68_03730 [Euryarchaeota archaeon RBG_16_68_13]
MRLPARRIAPGRAEGLALVSGTPFSFVGGADPATGTVLDDETGLRGERLADRIFAFPHAKGSTVGSYVLYGLAKRGVGPAAIVNVKAETIVAVGAILGGIPMVDGVDLGGLRTGDRVVVDAEAGFLDLPDVSAKPVVSVFLHNKGRYLLVRRSEAVGSFPGRWSAVSGYVEGDEDPRTRAAREIREETGIRGARFRRAGSPVVARDADTAYVVHPFLFDIPHRRVRLDWENVEKRWVRAAEISSFDTVPRLGDVMSSALSSRYVRKG